MVLTDCWNIIAIIIQIICRSVVFCKENICRVSINKPTNTRIIISALEIVQPNFLVVVVRTISEGVDICDANRILRNSTYAPSIIGISCNGFCVLVNDSDYVTLQVLYEVVGNVVVENTANAVLVVVERNESVAAPCLTENLGTVESIGVENTVYLLARSDTVRVVSLVNDSSIRLDEFFELSALFPSQVMTEVGGGVALTHYIIFEWKCQ